MSTSMSLRPKRDLQFSHCVCDASLAAIKKSSYELDVPFCAQSLLVGECWFESFGQVYPKLQYLLQTFNTLVVFWECTQLQFTLWWNDSKSSVFQTFYLICYSHYGNGLCNAHWWVYYILTIYFHSKWPFFQIWPNWLQKFNLLRFQSKCSG